MAQDDWFAPSYFLSVDDRAAIYAWVKEQQWPEGTVLKEPSKYHITAFYSRSGFSNPDVANWGWELPQAQFDISIEGVETFSTSDGHTMAPAVLLCNSPALVEHAKDLIVASEDIEGVKALTNFEYRPHITVAVVPSEVTMDGPDLVFQAHGPQDHHQQSIDSKEHRRIWKGGYEGGGLYRHYKGGEYKVLGVGLNKTTDVAEVIYVSHATLERFWTRNLQEFNEKAPNGEPRFIRVN